MKISVPSGVPPPDQSQSEAIRLALVEPISLVVGTPGCGKSSTIATIVHNIALKGQVLAVAPSNAATDNLTELLLKAGMKVTLNNMINICVLTLHHFF